MSILVMHETLCIFDTLFRSIAPLVYSPVLLVLILKVGIGRRHQTARRNEVIYAIYQTLKNNTSNNWIAYCSNYHYFSQTTNK